MTDPASAPQPPDDAEDWTDEQWLDWLRATDTTEPASTVLPPRPKPSMGKQLIGAAMLGMHEAIYGPKQDEVAIVVDAGGDPPGPDGLELELGDDPTTSKARYHKPPTD